MLRCLENTFASENLVSETNKDVSSLKLTCFNILLVFCNQVCSHLQALNEGKRETLWKTNWEAQPQQSYNSI